MPADRACGSPGRIRYGLLTALGLIRPGCGSERFVIGSSKESVRGAFQDRNAGAVGVGAPSEKELATAKPREAPPVPDLNEKILIWLRLSPGCLWQSDSLWSVPHWPLR
jgi:hypothetical protein